MAVYSKFYPNVFLAKTENTHQKGDTLILITKYGKENKCIVHNLIYSKDGFNYYSFTRFDGFNSQVRAENRAEKINGWATNAEKRSISAYEASKEGKDFLALGEPIKIGHHSERRHRALIERNHNRMSKCIQESDKAKEYTSRVEYWESKANTIDLSMPESLEYFQFKLNQAQLKHENLKNNPEKREHSFSLTYAKKELNELTKKFEIAKKLWL
jgi:hypothetical protein